MSVKGGEFARGTEVPSEKTRMEIEQTLLRYGATGFAYAASGSRRRVEFAAHERHVRFELDLPALSDRRFIGRRDGWRGPSEAVRLERWKAEERRLWRALLLAIKAKLEVVASGMAIFEEEFLANIVMPDGRTAGQHAIPAIAKAYQTGRVVGLLPEHT
jgi:hypothetical protein